MKRVLLTGIGGSIGCHTLAHIMTNTDWEVIGVDSFAPRDCGETDRLYMMFRNHSDWQPRTKIFTHDLRAPFSDKLIEKIGDIDYIISMASLSEVETSIKNPTEFIVDNVKIATNVLDYAARLWSLYNPEHKVPEGKAFIQISTDEVYGPSGPDVEHKEWSPILPSNPYSASKAAQEASAIAYWRSYGLPLIIVNTMNNFGEMQSPAKYPSVIQRCLLEGKPVPVYGTEDNTGSRFYIHSRNHADALLYLLKNRQPYLHQDGEIDKPDRFNIVGDKRITNLELGQIIARLMGKEFKYELVDFYKARPGHDRDYGLDGTKLRELGWKSPMTFEESMKRTLSWTERHPQWLGKE